MALFHKLSVNLRVCLCDVLSYVSAQSLDFLDFVKNSLFLNWKLISVLIEFLDGHELTTPPFQSVNSNL